MRGHRLLARLAYLQPPPAGERHHADQRLGVQLGQARVVVARLELGAQDVLDLVRHVVEHAGEAAGRRHHR